MKEKTWDKILVAEHEMIERAMDILKRELEKMPQAEIDLFFLKRAIDFLLEFGDRIHNHKEEEWLFPLLAERGVPQDGPIRVMLSEHEYERDLLLQMNNSAPGIALSSESEKVTYKEKGMEYLEIRANHIWKENDVLYAMGRKAFSAEDNTFLVNAFDGFSRGIYGDDFENRILKMLQEVEKGEAARKSLIENLSYEQIDAIMETLPFEVTFVDDKDTVAYFNRLDKEKIFVRTRSVIGRKVFKCHPEKSVHLVQRIVEGFKDGSMDQAEFWIDMKGDKVHIRYFPVRSTQGDYMGVLEVSQLIGDIQKLSGEKRLLD
jgi:DUF438 domain-containing protein